MVISCSAANCTKRLTANGGQSFHRFPHSDPERLRKWTLALRRDGWTPTKSSYLCSDHFLVSDYYSDQRGRRCLKKEAVPTVFEFTQQLCDLDRNSDSLTCYVFDDEISAEFETERTQGMFTSTGCSPASTTTNIFGEDVMKQPLIGKQFSLCPDTGELEASRRSKQQQVEQAEGVGLALSEGQSLVGTDLVDAKLLASLSFDNLDLKLESHELLDHVVKSEFADAVALAAGGVDMDSTPVKREPGSMEEEMPTKVRRVMVNESQQQQTRFLIAWKAENNELVPVCIPVQTGATGGTGQKVQLSDGTTLQLAPGTDLMSLTGNHAQGQVLSGVSSPQQQQVQHTPQQSPQPQAQPQAQQVQQVIPVSGATQGTIIQLPANNIIPALAQGATLQIPAGSAFPGLTQALQIPSSGIIHAAGSQGTVLQLPTPALNSSEGATIVQIPAGHLAQQQVQHQHLQLDAGQALGPESIVIKEDHDMNVGEGEEVLEPEKGLNLAGAGDDVSSSSVAESAGQTSSAAPRGVETEEVELEATEEQEDSESWRLRHAVTILEKSQINFLRDARRSFKCYQCGGLIRPPALEVEVDLAPYGIRPVLCTDCGKFHLNKRNVNVRVTTDEGCEQLHRFMSA